MFDGIGDDTEVWRGRAAYLAGPKPSEDMPDDGQERHIGPLINHGSNPYLRYKVHLPLVPGRVLSSVVAVKRPESAELVAKALPYWEQLHHHLGAVARQQLKTDATVLSDLLGDIGHEFTALVASGLDRKSVV